MRSLIFLALIFFLSCAGSVADPKSAGASADAGVSNPVLDAAPAVPSADGGQASASIVMPAADVKLAVPAAPTGADPGDVDGKPAPVDSVKSSAAGSSGAPVAVPATFARPTN